MLAKTAMPDIALVSPSPSQFIDFDTTDFSFFQVFSLLLQEHSS
jgi:hypothetical protein